MTRPDHAFDLIEEITATVNGSADALQVGPDTLAVANVNGSVLKSITPDFSADNTRLARLTTWRNEKKIEPLHVLDENIWISFAADSGADIDVHPSSDLEGFVINVNDIGASPWMSLSWQIDLDAVRRGRYFCFVMKMRSPGFLSYRPCLRFVGATDTFKFTDVFSRDSIVSSGGEIEQLSWVHIEPTLAESAKRTEAHVFFQGACFSAEIRSMNVALIN